MKAAISNLNKVILFRWLSQLKKKKKKEGNKIDENI